MGAHLQQSYFLDLPAKLGADFSVLNFQLHEALGQAFRLELDATSPRRDHPVAELLQAPAAFRIEREGGLEKCSRIWHGVLRGFSRGRISKDETLYHILMAPRLDTLKDFHNSSLFQNQSVPEIVEAALRRRGLGGADFRFHLSRDYVRREYTTQYQETDFDFIRRLLEDEGLWFRVEEKDGRDLVVFGDDPAHYRRDLPAAFFREDAGLESPRLEAVLRLFTRAAPARELVRHHDYNYRAAGEPLLADAAAREPKGLSGITHFWGEHHKTLDEGRRLSRIEHEASLARQVESEGEGNILALAPGRVLTLSRPFPEAENGWLVTAVRHRGRRDQAYANHFELMPAECSFRLPRVTPRPKIHGSLPAVVVSPGGYQYAFLDEMGRYRVRLPFDRDQWNQGCDSRPVRLGKSYAGPDYGQHFPLLEGTEVMLSFSGGDPDRPHISGVMHNSRQEEHVPDSWNSRNVIRTAANNKLRMEDRQGEEHIKLATEHGKSQLNLGHLVDAERTKRGDGFELRSDSWGALRAGQGLFLSADGQSRAGGEQLSMNEAIAGLRKAALQAKNLAQAAKSAQTQGPAEGAVEKLGQALEGLKEPGLLMSAPENAAALSPETLLLRSQNEAAFTANRNLDLATLKNLVETAAQKLSLLALGKGANVAAGVGELKVEAHGGPLNAVAKQDLVIASGEKTAQFLAQKEVTLSAGGGYLTIKDGQIELGCPGRITLKVPSWQRQGPASLTPELPVTPGVTEELVKEEDKREYEYEVAYETTDRFLAGALMEGVGAQASYKTRYLCHLERKGSGGYVLHIDAYITSGPIQHGFKVQTFGKVTLYDNGTKLEQQNFARTGKYLLPADQYIFIGEATFELPPPEPTKKLYLEPDCSYFFFAPEGIVPVSNVPGQEPTIIIITVVEKQNEK